VTSRRVLLTAVAAGLVAGGALAAALALAGRAPAPSPVAHGAAVVQALLRGIPQQGERLGSPRARVTLVEFADPQCPYCARWAREGLPGIVRRYVRTGKVRLMFAGLAFVGPDSATALRTALAAGRQNRLWNVIELLYANQAGENSGWVTEPLLRSIGAAVPGLDTARMLRERTSAAVERAVGAASALAARAGVPGTPAFAVGRTGGALRLVAAPSDVTAALDAALAS
jgi:protein-disulfide isomerase